jgi:hypothetical protein
MKMGEGVLATIENYINEKLMLEEAETTCLI